MSPSLSTLLSSSAEDAADKIGIIYGDRRYTYGELNDRVNKLANGLASLGLSKGDKAGILLRTCPEYVEAICAIQRIGAVPVPVNARYSLVEVQHVLADSRCTTLIHGEEFSGVVGQVPTAPVKRSIVVGGSPSPNARSYEKLVSESPADKPHVETSDDDIAVLLYTSGTTGKPKAVPTTHGNLYACIDQAFSYMQQLIERGELPKATLFPPSGEMRTLATVPFFHYVGLVLLVRGLEFKNPMIMPRSKSFNPAEIYELIQRERPTLLFMVPAMYQMLLGFPDIGKYDLSSVSMAITGGSKMPVEMKQRLLDVFPNVTLAEGLGTTEAGIIAMSFAGQENRYELGDGLVPVPGVEARIVNEEGRDVGPGEIGELIYRIPWAATEYYGNPEQTAKVFRGGWVYSEDISKMDEKGSIHILQRKDDVINTGGEKVLPVEVEEVIQKHPKVAQVAIIGAPDTIWGQAVKAIVKPKPGQSLTDREIMEFCEGKMARFMKPKSVVFVESLPFTVTGKIARAKLRELYGR